MESPTLTCLFLHSYCIQRGSLLLSLLSDSSYNASFDSVIQRVQPCYISNWKTVKSKENALNN